MIVNKTLKEKIDFVKENRKFFICSFIWIEDKLDSPNFLRLENKLEKIKKDYLALTGFDITTYSDSSSKVKIKKLHKEYDFKFFCFDGDQSSSELISELNEYLIEIKEFGYSDFNIENTESYSRGDSLFYSQKIFGVREETELEFKMRKEFIECIDELYDFVNENKKSKMEDRSKEADKAFYCKHLKEESIKKDKLQKEKEIMKKIKEKYSIKQLEAMLDKE